jgi:hypothetical protein
MRISIAIIPSLLLLCSCGKASGSDVTLPVNPVYRAELQQEINRIEPQLQFQNGIVSKAGSVGDGAIFTGLYFSSSQSNPNILSLPDDILCRSRDQFMGIIINLAAHRDRDQAAVAYSRCDSQTPWSPRILALTSFAWRTAGMRPQRAMLASEPFFEDGLITEAKNNEGYRLHLVSLNVWATVLLNRLTGTGRDIARILVERQPSNLWFQYLDNLTHDGDATRYENTAKDLLGLMQSWPQGDRSQWCFERDSSENACVDSSGHEFVFLARLLNR